jgi:type IV secretion system protein VirD4
MIVQQQPLLLGWSSVSRADALGFAPAAAGAHAEVQPVTYDGDGPLITCAPTGAGKGRGVLIPNLLHYRGQVIVMDIKGELYHVTNRYRRQMGHQVVVLDPFELVTTGGDSLNPFDLMSLPQSDFESDAEVMASLLAVGNQFSSDPYWNTTANSFVSGLIAHIASYPPKERHLGHLRAWLYHDDLDMAIARMLDKNQVQSRMARDQFVAYLTAPREQTRPCIRSTACSYLSALGSEQVLKSVRTSSFRLQDVYDGQPLSVYIVIPPDKLDSHKSLLRLWVSTLLTAVVRRERMPRQRTLFLLDEVAQLGPLSILRQAVTLLRGSGLQPWLFLQDLSQLRQLYPNDWPAIVNNAGALQVFGINNHGLAREWGELLGQAAETLDRMPREEAAVRRQGQGSTVCRRADYLQDEAFAGRFDDNPRFA